MWTGHAYSMQFDLRKALASHENQMSRPLPPYVKGAEILRVKHSTRKTAMRLTRPQSAHTYSSGRNRMQRTVGKDNDATKQPQTVSIAHRFEKPIKVVTSREFTSSRRPIRPQSACVIRHTHRTSTKTAATRAAKAYGGHIERMQTKANLSQWRRPVSARMAVAPIRTSSCVIEKPVIVNHQDYNTKKRKVMLQQQKQKQRRRPRPHSAMTRSRTTKMRAAVVTSVKQPTESRSTSSSSSSSRDHAELGKHSITQEEPPAAYCMADQPVLMSVVSLEQLPTDVMTLILEYISFPQVFRALICVSKKMHSMIVCQDALLVYRQQMTREECVLSTLQTSYVEVQRRQAMDNVLLNIERQLIAIWDDVDVDSLSTWISTAMKLPKALQLARTVSHVLTFADKEMTEMAKMKKTTKNRHDIKDEEEEEEEESVGVLPSSSSVRNSASRRTSREVDALDEMSSLSSSENSEQDESTSSSSSCSYSSSESDADSDGSEENEYMEAKPPWPKRRVPGNVIARTTRLVPRRKVLNARGAWLREVRNKRNAETYELRTFFTDTCVLGKLQHFTPHKVSRNVLKNVHNLTEYSTLPDLAMYTLVDTTSSSSSSAQKKPHEEIDRTFTWLCVKLHLWLRMLYKYYIHINARTGYVVGIEVQVKRQDMTRKMMAFNRWKYYMQKQHHF